MCGIVGYIGHGNALDVLVSGLEKLEYRGYDSAGVAVYEGGQIHVSRAQGNLSNLKNLLAEQDKTCIAHLGIGHTRWATHGKPSENNAHPHSAGRVSLIHNGIIENYLELRAELSARGSKFLSETDTEIAAHLLNELLTQGLEPFEALRACCARIRGSYAFLAIDKEHPDRILVAKNATPIVIGLGERETFIASDIPAILHHTRRVIVLEDGDMAVITKEGIAQLENSGQPVQRKEEYISWDPVTAQKGGYRHYMLKEIFEQGTALTETFRGRVELEKGSLQLFENDLTSSEVANVRRIVLVACGTAWHACLLAKFYIEKFSGIPCEVDYASEFRYRGPVLDKQTLCIAISQSGETADTLAAIELAGKSSPTLAICNVLGASIPRKVERVLYTHAGPEISVASTKAFTTQVLAAFLLALSLGEKRGVLTQESLRGLLENLVQLPAVIESALAVDTKIEELAKKYHAARDFLFLGRGLCYPIALEGALKMKELSYIHAEGYPAGEMKHGPLALIDEHMPIVVVMQNSRMIFEKTLSNLREAHARRGKIIAVTDCPQVADLNDCVDDLIQIPFLAEELSPISLSIPLQLLCYHVAVFNGTDVDQPRNLAKSVTVE